MPIVHLSGNSKVKCKQAHFQVPSRAPFQFMLSVKKELRRLVICVSTTVSPWESSLISRHRLWSRSSKSKGGFEEHHCGQRGRNALKSASAPSLPSPPSPPAPVAAPILTVPGSTLFDPLSPSARLSALAFASIGIHAYVRSRAGIDAFFLSCTRTYVARKCRPC